MSGKESDKGGCEMNAVEPNVKEPKGREEEASKERAAEDKKETPPGDVTDFPVDEEQELSLSGVCRLQSAVFGELRLSSSFSN